ncbi:MAG: hypothetical protein WD628_05730 [Thermomicrobiales bacterium]
MEFLSVTIGVVFLLIVVSALIAIVSRNIIKVPPSTVAIFSGRKRQEVDPNTGEKFTVG